MDNYGAVLSVTVSYAVYTGSRALDTLGYIYRQVIPPTDVGC